MRPKLIAFAALLSSELGSPFVLKTFLAVDECISSPSTKLFIISESSDKCAIILSSICE